MKINDLKEMCLKDTKINSMNIDGYSLAIPELSNKYHQLAFDEKKTLRFLEAQYNIIKREKWLYYSGKANNDVYDNAPFDLKILAKDVDMFLSSDKLIIDIKEKIEEQRDKIKIIEDTSKLIQNSSFNISNVIKWKKFLAGDMT